MVTYKRKKLSRQRASHTHGWGSKKKHRGAGHRGGVGMAGTGKRADQKKPSIWDKDYFGMHGFKKKGKVISYNPINICDLSNLDKTDLVLSEFGYNKLLAKGTANKAYNITVDYASENAIAKIEEAGGKVKVLKGSSDESEEKEEKKEKQDKK
jgi:large subunit ribosomal protein L15